MKKNKNTLIEWAMKYRAVPLAIAFILGVTGIFGLFNMPRNEFPDFTIRQGLIVGVYPGASPEQVEKQLTSKVEEYLFSFDEVDKNKTYSYSKNGMMYIYVEVASRIDHNSTQQFWNKLKNGMLVFQQTELPREVQGVFVNSDFGSTAAMILAVESESRPYKDLQRHVEAIEEDLRQIEDMSKISHSGGLAEEVSILVDNNKLAQYGISPGLIMQSLKAQGAITPAGTLDGKETDKPILFTTFFQAESDLARQVIRSDENGNIIRLRDIATITRTYEDRDAYVTTNGTKSMIITLEMAAGNNIVQFGKEIDEHLERLEAGLPADIKITKLADQPEVVDNSIGHFMKEFGYALMGVVLVTLLLLPFRIASVAAATIPVTIAATLAVMYLFGIELNTVTLAALIVVLGIVVDDPIVVIDNHVEKLDSGEPVWKAARDSAIELFPSVFTATLAISATFLPLVFFMEGVASDFVSAFPYTIMIALFLSLIISVLLVPFINTVFIKKGLHTEFKVDQKKSMLNRLQEFFDKSVVRAMDHYKLTVFVGIAAVVIGLLLFSMVTLQLFPKVERNQFAVEINLAKSYNLNKTDSIVKRFERVMENDERIVTYTSFIGSSSPRFHTLYAPNLPAENYAQILVNTVSEEATAELLQEYDEKYADMFPEAYLRMKQLDMVPASAPIEVRLYGEDISELKKLGDQIIDISRKTTNTIWSRTDFGGMQEVMSLDVNVEETGRLGLSRVDIANTVAMNMEGVNATTIWEEEYPINVMIKSKSSGEQTVSNLRELSIIVPQDRSTVPLRQVADVESSWVQEQISRRNGMRCLTVRIDIAKDAVANDVLSSLTSKISELDIPENIRVEYGGEYEMQQENIGPMGLSLLTSIVVIFLILLWHFKSFPHAFLSIMTMPLSVLGAALGLLLMDYPFGFTSFMGILALCGIVVRNGIILVDFADEVRLKNNLTVREAVIQAAQRRMRPIFLTSSAATVGVIPMILSRSTLWGPLGTVIAFGLMVSMVLTLFVLPVLYWLFFRKKDETKALENENQKHSI